MKHPIQPLEKDYHGTMRFKENKIVSYLLDNGGIDLNKLALVEFTNNDREQFSQLIGYSLSGFGELRHVSDETYNTAEGTLNYSQEIKVHVYVDGINYDGSPHLAFTNVKFDDNITPNGWVYIEESHILLSKNNAELILLFNGNLEKIKTPEQEIAELKAKLANYEN